MNILDRLNNRNSSLNDDFSLFSLSTGLFLSEYFIAERIYNMDYLYRVHKPQAYAATKFAWQFDSRIKLWLHWSQLLF